MGDERWSTLLAVHHAGVREQVERHDGTLIKTMGDGVLATFDRPTLAVRCALAISRHAGEEGVQVRAGVHAGECEVTDDDISGVAAHVGSRIMALAGPAEVLVSATVRDLVFGSGVDFEARGEHELKGLPGRWAVHAVVSDRREDQRPASQATPEHAALTPSPVDDDDGRRPGAGRGGEPGAPSEPCHAEVAQPPSGLGEGLIRRPACRRRRAVFMS